MSLHKPVAIGFLILLCSTLSVAQNKPKPNLSGTWIVDSAKSENSNNFLEDAVKSVTIEQNDPTIKSLVSWTRSRSRLSFTQTAEVKRTTVRRAQ